MEISEELAEIIGLLCAEGCYINTRTSYWGKERGKMRYRKNKLQKRIEFGNIDPILLNHFKELVEKEYNYTPGIGKDRARICKGGIIDNITSYTDLGHLKWKVPESVMNGNEIIKSRFLRGFFEGDGTVSNRIRFFSTNLQGLKQITKLLDSLSIKNKLNGPALKPRRKPFYEIYIFQSERERFLNKLQPITKIPDLCGGKF